MEYKNFSEVFKNLSFSEVIRETFDNSKISDLKIISKEKTVSFNMSIPGLIDESLIDTLKTQLKNQLPGIINIDIGFSYDLENKKGALIAYKDTLYNYISQMSPVCKSLMKSSVCIIDDTSVTYMLKSGTSFLMKEKNIDRLLEKKISDCLGISAKVEFFDKEMTKEEKEKIKSEFFKREEEIAKEVSKESYTETVVNEKPVKEKTEPQETDILLGKKITEDKVNIHDLSSENEKVVIEGFIFNIETREINGKRGKVYLVTFYITDYTDSTSVKFFADKDVFDTRLSENIKNGKYVKIRGEYAFDNFQKEMIITAKDINKADPPKEKMDNYEGEKRVELHLHTQMSQMDGITSAKDLIKRAAKWGHKAIAITDHGVVQAYPEAMSAAAANNIKVIYGMEAYLIDDLGSVVENPRGQTLDDEFVVFDIETTGLSREVDRITEIGAVKIQNGKITDKYSVFVNPEMSIPEKITKLTGITDEMVKNAKTIDVILPEFLDFCKNAILVAHNAPFDVGFIRANAKRLDLQTIENTVIDTVGLSRSLLTELKSHSLDNVCEALGVTLEGHHRAVNDANATALAFLKLIDMLAEKEVYRVDEINIVSSQTVNYNKLKAYHAVILAKDYTGLRNLYELVSLSHLKYFYRRPRIPKTELLKRREGLILGSACEAGELFRAILEDKPLNVIEEIARFYDYLEIQPLGNNMFMIDSDRVSNVNSVEDIKNLNKRIIELGEKLNKPVVATCDVHFMDKRDDVYRKIIMAAEGFPDADNQAPLYFRTTEEMLEEFMYLGEEKAKEVVIKNTNLISDMVEEILPIPKDTYPPEIEGAEDTIRQITMDKVHSIYGEELPEIVVKRLDKELNSIIKNGFSVMYIIAQKLVWNSNDNGYLVGSRGSVGSSFVATMLGITEVNPLPPHYVCPNCKYSDFDSEVVKETFMAGGSGCDMPDCVCPKCGTLMNKEGHDIPFETFLGFDGDKEPDIDLNFSGEYQQQAHAYTETLFGKGNVYKAGTIGTVAEKTAFVFVKKYLEERNMTLHNAEIARLTNGCTGIKRTTGQHPGGLMIVPRSHDIHEFCPIQRPANDMKSTITTTHFDYHSISGRLLKLDLLGHDDPTVIRMLYDLTGVNPQSVKLDDKKTMSLFDSPDALGVTREQINCHTGTFGIPEFGTKFTRQMLEKTKPKTFSDLIRISGLSHGTDVWTGNAETLIEKGVITLKESISTRDSIMSYLITKGVPNKTSFKIMEKVRKGKGLTEEDIAIMKENNVPDWYIESCQKIKYMFPKAHAAAYVMMAFRIAYFKINYPLAYYASYFSVRAVDDFDYDSMCKGCEAARQAVSSIAQKGNEATTKDKNKLTVLEIIIEFYERGFTFLPIDLYKSDDKKFIIEGNALIPPFASLQGLGTTAASSIVEARKDGEFTTIEDFKQRTSLGKTLIELLKEHNVLKGIPETNQLTLF